jgi:hypothetical protein
MPFRVLTDEFTKVDLQFALLLRDGFTDSDQLLGEVSVTAGNIQGQQKESSGTFLFFDLTPGALALSVSSDPETPYYLPATVGVAIPVPDPPPLPPPFLWPAFPDIRLADPTLPLGDAGQKPAYIAQRKAATLLPATAYPFPEGTTLIRGTVRHAGNPQLNATVQQVGSTDPAYVTAGDGQFVLFWKDAPGVPQTVTVNVKHAGLADGNVNVTVVRGLTVSVTVDM